MKTLLVQPPRILAESYKYPPLSLGYLAANLKHNGFKFDVIDLDGEDAKVEDFLKRFSTTPFDYDLVAITCATVSYPAALSIAHYSKLLNPSTTVVIGGPHVTFLAREVLMDSKDVDIVVRGEGEFALLEIADAIQKRSLDFTKINGISYRNNGEIVENPDRDLIRDIDCLPIPDWSEFPMDLYLAPAIITSRGCPRKCIYCAATSIHSVYRRRSIESVIIEIKGLLKWIKRTPNYQLTFFDNTFTGDYLYSYKMTEAIKGVKCDIRWTAEMRVDGVDDKLLKLMKESGCVYIHYGIESGSQQILDSIGKKINVNKAKEVVEASLDLGIEVACSFCIGHPNETLESIEITINLIKELQAMGAKCNTSIVTPFPGTELRNNYEKYELKIHNVSWEKYTLFNPVMDTRYLTREEMGQAFARLLMETNAFTKVSDIKSMSEQIRNFRKEITNNAN